MTQKSIEDLDLPVVIRVHSKEQREGIQELLFEYGVKWRSGARTVMEYPDARYLIVSKRGILTKSYDSPIEYRSTHTWLDCNKGIYRE